MQKKKKTRTENCVLLRFLHKYPQSYNTWRVLVVTLHFICVTHTQIQIAFPQRHIFVFSFNLKYHLNVALILIFANIALKLLSLDITLFKAAESSLQ